jgi:two-component system, NarL family, invasion response regulator UvrY
MLKFLVADDHAVMRRGLREILNDYAETALVDEARDGKETLHKASTDDWDLIILDIAMPDTTGLEILRQLRASVPQVPVLMLSAHSAPYYVRASLNAGAAGYVSKDAASEELVAAVETALHGGKYVSRCLARRLALRP